MWRTIRLLINEKKEEKEENSWPVELSGIRDPDRVLTLALKIFTQKKEKVLTS